MMITKFTYGNKPHTSVVIDIYRQPGTGTCTSGPDLPAEKIVFGTNGCESCLVESISQLIATDEKFARFVSDCLHRVGSFLPLQGIDNAATVWLLLDTLRLCERALAECYDINSWPADGTTVQDIALSRAKYVIDHIIKLKNETGNTRAAGGDSGTEKVG